jgi:hypothetical protein
MLKVGQRKGPNMERTRTKSIATISGVLALLFLGTGDAFARPPIRGAFFNNYPTVTNTRLDELISNANHCGLCHLDFDGGGARNAYGLDIQVAINSGLYADFEAAILSVENNDSDSDGYSNLIEATDFLNFTNTPTFPGLTTANLPSLSHVDTAEISAYLTPAGSNDTDPPVVTVTWPTGGEALSPVSVNNVQWTATDASGIAHVDIYLSDDNGVSFKQVGRHEPDDGVFEWMVPNMPGTQNLIRVAARDNAGNYGNGDSAGLFEIEPVVGGKVPTTLRDFFQPGTQAHAGVVLVDPDVTCRSCHGDYNSAIEPWYLWKGSMMAQAQRDPVFLATLAVAEQDAPAVGDMCLRCHTPGGWFEGRSVDTLGGQVTALDRQGVQCDYCHRLVDPVYTPGVSPAKDADVLAALDQIPPDYGNGMAVADPDPIRRGPYADAQASHEFLDSAIHRSSNLCGSCHNVSNPVFKEGTTPGTYVPDTLDQQHLDNTTDNMAPVERTFAEWLQSEYASTGVYAPQFAGDKPDGIVSSCQDCHMADTTGKGSNQNSPNRTDLGTHDLTGGNHFAPDIIPTFFGGEVDVAHLQAGKARVIAMLQKAATLVVTQGPASGLQPTVDVEVINETGHKLPTGYPEGRRVWVNVRAYDGSSNLIYESGAYDASTGELSHDPDAKIYHTEPGISADLAPIVGLPAGPSFHFALNNEIFVDNRIPPRGFTNAGFASVQAQPVGHSYADGAHSDVTHYVLPVGSASVDVNLYYQSTSKEYVEFLRDENVTNSWGQDLYDAWVAQGRAAPVTMATQTLSLDATAVVPGTRYETKLVGALPNPFNARAEIHYSMERDARAKLVIYDVAGRRVRTLLDQRVAQGEHFELWNGRDDRGQEVASGSYLVRFQALGIENSLRVVLLK